MVVVRRGGRVGGALKYKTFCLDDELSKTTQLIAAEQVSLSLSVGGFSLTLASLFSHTDSVEDDFELSTVCHRPESMDKLQEQTKFTKKELQVLYRGFKNVGGEKKNRIQTHANGGGFLNRD